MTGRIFRLYFYECMILIIIYMIGSMFVFILKELINKIMMLEWKYIYIDKYKK